RHVARRRVSGRDQRPHTNLHPIAPHGGPAERGAVEWVAGLQIARLLEPQCRPLIVAVRVALVCEPKPVVRLCVGRFQRRGRPAAAYRPASNSNSPASRRASAASAAGTSGRVSSRSISSSAAARRPPFASAWADAQPDRRMGWRIVSVLLMPLPPCSVFTLYR